MFITKLHVHEHDQPGWWVLDAELVWRTPFEMWHVPKGFVTDFGSIPPLFRILPSFSPSGVSAKAATLHDFHYAVQVLERRAADDLFFRALLASGTNLPAAQLFWCGVRIGGWLAWWKRRKEN